LKLVVAPVTNDDVIEHCDPDNVSGRCEPTSDVHIVWRWCWIAGRMVMRVMCRRSLCGRGHWEPPITPVDTLIAAT